MSVRVLPATEAGSAATPMAAQSDDHCIYFGLKADTAQSGVTVLTIKPVFVYTPMTEGMEMPPLLTARPEQVAIGIDKAVQAAKQYVRTGNLEACDVGHQAHFRTAAQGAQLLRALK